MMNMTKCKIINFCDNAILCSLYAIAFFLPISKAIIESLSILAIIFYLIKKFLGFDDIIKTPINRGIYIYLAICILSIFLSSNLKISARTFFSKTLQDIGFLLAAAETLTKGRRIRNILYVLFISSFVLGVDGIYQYFTHGDFIRHRPVIFTERIYASFTTPNAFGCYLSMVLPFLLTHFFFKLRLRVSKIVYAGLFLLLFICLLLTISRGAWFAFLSSVLFLAVWIRSLSSLFLILGIIMIITQQFYPLYLKERFKDFFVFTDTSSIDRKIIWQAGWKMFMFKPWIGVGLGTFMFNFKRFVIEKYPHGVPYAHNCYLQMASEIGIIGLSAFLFIIGLFFYHGLKFLRSKERNFFWYVLLASQAAILGYCVQMGVDTILYSLDLGMLFWLVLGIGVAAMQNLKSRVSLPKQVTLE